MPGRFTGPWKPVAGRPWSIDIAKQLDKFMGRAKDAIAILQGAPGTPTTVDATTAADPGEGPEPAMHDHQHDADVSGTPLDITAAASAQGPGPGLATSNHGHRFAILTAKGDVLAHDISNPVRVPVGSDGQVLTAASGATPGVQWATPAPPASSVVSKVFADSPYTVPATVDVVLFDATGGNSTVNLPAAASCPGHVFHILKTDASANTVTIDGNGAETIGASGAATQVLSSQGQGISIVSNGTAFFITGFIV